VYKINEQIPEMRSCLSTLRDMYWEVVECLNDVNKSIYGLPAIVVFIAANVAEIIYVIYHIILFPRDYYNDRFHITPLFRLLMKTMNVLTLYMNGHATENEVFIYYIFLEFIVKLVSIF